MNIRVSVLSRLALGLVVASLVFNGATASAQSPTTSIKVPIVMEAATVRGKVAVLESARDERRVASDLKVAVWSTKSAKEEVRGRRHHKSETQALERDKLLHETKTDELGLFDLPQLDVGEYMLDVSEIEFRLTVIPQSSERAGQTEPKVLLILVPKEVISIRSDKSDAAPAPQP